MLTNCYEILHMCSPSVTCACSFGPQCYYIRRMGELCKTLSLIRPTIHLPYFAFLGYFSKHTTKSRMSLLMQNVVKCKSRKKHVKCEKSATKYPAISQLQTTRETATNTFCGCLVRKNYAARELSTHVSQFVLFSLDILFCEKIPLIS